MKWWRRTAPLDGLEAKRIALIKPSALGDIVHSLPVLGALRHRYPQARIVWVVNKSYESLIEGHPDLDATIPFDRTATDEGLWGAMRSVGAFVRRLRAENFDLAIDLQGLIRSGLMCYLTGAKRRVGLATARECSCWFYTDVIETRGLPELHAVDRYWQIVKALGVEDYPVTFRLPIHTEALEWARETLITLPRPWIMVSVGTRWETKRVPPNFFGVLLKRAQDQFGGTVIFVGREDEQRLALAAASHLDDPCTRMLTGETNLSQLAAVLSLADVVVANDSGPLHLAVALGRPVVAPYTCTKVSRHGPYGQAKHTIETKVSCAGSYLRQCPKLECMSEIHPDRLWPKLQEILATCQVSQTSPELRVER